MMTGHKIPSNCQHYTVDNIDKMIKFLRKAAIIKVLRTHEGLPEDPANTDSLNYLFFKKIFDTLRTKFKEAEMDDIENVL